MDGMICLEYAYLFWVGFIILLLGVVMYGTGYEEGQSEGRRKAREEKIRG
jgi:hypothetical protein